MRSNKLFRLYFTVATNHLTARLRDMNRPRSRDREVHIRTRSQLVDLLAPVGDDDELICLCSSSCDFPREYTSDPCVLDLIATLLDR